MTTNNAVDNGLTGATGTGSFVGSTSPTLVTPALGTPSAVNLSNATSLVASALPSGAMFNLQQTQMTGIFSSTSTSMTDVTGLSVSITPTSSSNSVLVRIVIQFATTTGTSAFFQLVRGATPIALGAAAGSRIQASAAGNVATATSNVMQTAVIEWLDSPATTSATTYKIQGMCNTTGTFYVNTSNQDLNTNQFARTPSVITAMEVHA